MQQQLACRLCGKPLVLNAETSNYVWRCPSNCISPLDTGVQANEPFDELLADGTGEVEFNATHFFPPMTKKRETTARIFMPQILLHFISCSRGACYNSIYASVLVPYLDRPELLDYILCGIAIADGPNVFVGKSGAKLFPELYHRLQGVNCRGVQEYLLNNFGSR